MKKIRKKKKRYHKPKGSKVKPRSVGLTKQRATRLTNETGDVLSMHLSYHQLVFGRYFQQLGDRVDELREFVTASAVRTFLSILNPPRQFSAAESVDLLLHFKQSLEDRIADIVSRHSAYYWMHLYRRLAPENTFGHQSLVSVALYREAMEAAFAKYGRAEIGDDLIMGSDIDPGEIMSGELKSANDALGIGNVSCSGVYIKTFSMNHFMELLALERLVAEFCQVAADLRRAYKGGRLVVESTESYRVLNDSMTESLIRSFDERNEVFGITATDVGVPLESPDAKTATICLVPMYNFRRKSLKEYAQDRLLGFSASEALESKDEMAPNFLLVPVDMGTLYSRLSFINEVFTEEYGFDLRCFGICFWALSHLPFLKSRMTGPSAGPSFAFEFLQRAYMPYLSLASIIDDIQSVIGGMAQHDMIAPEIEGPTPTINEISRFVNAFTLNAALRGRIDLVTRTPRPLVIETWQANYVVDFSALLSILLSGLHIQDADWTEKGTVFENYVIEGLTNKGFRLWERQKVLKASDGTQKEIDVSFQLGTALFVCECRCIGRSTAYERGEKKALDFRRKKYEDALQDCDTLAEWLSKHRRGTNFEIPQHVHIIIPVAVSPFVEYVWSDDEALWLTKEIPRLCTPEELGRISDREILSQIVHRPFVRYAV